MAKVEQTENRRLLGELSQTALESLDALAAELDEVEKDADALDSVGFDTSRIREHIASGRKIRDVIVSRFGPVKK